jgi:PKD repeat protein
LAHGITYGPTMKSLGPEQTVFDYGTEACDISDIPDEPARAFRDDQNRVQLLFAATEPRRNIGSDLDVASSPGHHDCTITSLSQQDSDPSQYNQYSWLTAPYTFDGHTIYSLVHTEYRAWLVSNAQNQPRCNPPGGDTTKCWYNAITLETSTNSGDFFTHTSSPSHLVASVPYQWVDQSGPYGVFSPSNIIRKQPDDGYLYAIVRAKEPGKADISCVMRTQETPQALADPTSWRAWGDGPDADSTHSFEVEFVNPYTYTFTGSDTPANHMCNDIGGGLVTGVSESLTYNTYFGKYILVGAYGDPVPGFFFSLSDDLVHWSYPKLLIGAETTHAWQCGDPDPVRDPSLLDPTSTSRNFETTGRRPYVYYLVLHPHGSCSSAFVDDHDLLRVQVEFTTAPSASFTISPNPAQTRHSVLFSGVSSSDVDGSIVDYRWDLDGDDTFETHTGSTPSVTHAYATAGTTTVHLRVTDDSGQTAETSHALTVNSSSRSQSRCAAVRAKERRLRLLLRSIRGNLARAKTPAGKRHYRRRIASVKRQLKRLAKTNCTSCVAIRKKRARLKKRLRAEQRHLAAAETSPQKKRLQRQIKMLKRQIQRLRCSR